MPDNISIEILEREFLELRARVIDLAAILDRISRGTGSVAEHELWRNTQTALQILLSDSKDRTERVQQVYSLPFSPHWRDELGV
jgi:hypothetical protein